MLEVCKVSKSYLKNRHWFSNEYQQVLHEVSFCVSLGECLGIVGESGSGKSTLARLILGLEKCDCGTIQINRNTRHEKSATDVSIVFQDYLSSVNPNMTVSQILLEALDIKGIKITNRQHRTEELLTQVGLSQTLGNAYPHELSGGQLQRLCIARAISTHPQLIILDEPTSSLDVLNQVKILNLLKALKEKYQLTYLFISHDLQAISYLSDQIIFLKNGRIAEQVKKSALFTVKSEYAKKLLLAMSQPQ